MRRARARRARAALGSAAVAANGALGISSKTCADGGGERRTATSAPPAQIFNAVANSRNSLPFSSRVRTKMGMANGNRTHWRRSFSGLRRIKASPGESLLPHSCGHLSCQIWTCVMADPGFLPEIPTYARQMPYPARNLPCVPARGQVLSRIVTNSSKPCRKCNDLPLCGNSGAFLIDNEGSPILRFDTSFSPKRQLVTVFPLPVCETTRVSTYGCKSG